MFTRLCLALLEQARWSERAVLQHAQMRKQVELLKYETDAASECVHRDIRGMDILSVDLDAPAFDRFESIDRADHGRFSRTRRTAHDHHLALGHGQANVNESMVVTIPFIHIFQGDHGSIHSKYGRQAGVRARRRNATE